jgi:hypothetical protein
MKAKQLFLLSFSISAIMLLLSCGFELLKQPPNPLYKVYSLDSISNRFPTSKNKKATTIIATKTNPDTLKTLIIVPEETYYKEMINNLKYFEEIRTIEELQSDIHKKAIKEEIQNLSSLIALNKAYRFYKPFVILKIKKGKTIIDDKKTAFYEMSLYNPKSTDLIFQSQIPYDPFIEGEGAKTIMNPLFNSLLDYLNEQNKNN